MTSLAYFNNFVAIKKKYFDGQTINIQRVSERTTTEKSTKSISYLVG